jgi:hypothetical protein
MCSYHNSDTTDTCQKKDSDTDTCLCGDARPCESRAHSHVSDGVAIHEHNSTLWDYLTITLDPSELEQPLSCSNLTSNPQARNQEQDGGHVTMSRDYHLDDNVPTSRDHDHVTKSSGYLTSEHGISENTTDPSATHRSYNDVMWDYLTSDYLTSDQDTFARVEASTHSSRSKSTMGFAPIFSREIPANRRPTSGMGRRLRAKIEMHSEEEELISRVRAKVAAKWTKLRQHVSCFSYACLLFVCMQTACKLLFVCMFAFCMHADSI